MEPELEAGKLGGAAAASFELREDFLLRFASVRLVGCGAVPC